MIRDEGGPLAFNLQEQGATVCGCGQNLGGKMPTGRTKQRKLNATGEGSTVHQKIM